eukprot:s1472_g1.t1
MPGRVMFLLTHFCGGVVSVDPFEYGNDTSTDSRERQLLDLGLDPKEGGAAELSSEVRKAAEYKLNLFVGRFTFTIALHAWKNSHVDPWLTVKWLLPLIRKRTVWARLEEMAAVPFARSFVLLTYIATAETAPPEAHQPLDRLQKEVDGLMRLREESQKVAASSRYAPEAEGGEAAETDAKHAVSVAEALLEEENKELREALANRRKQSVGKASLLESKATSSVSTHREASPAAAADASSWHLVLLLQAAMVIVGLALGALFWTMQRADRREAQYASMMDDRHPTF